MFAATATLSALLAGTLTFSAVRKLSHRPEVTRTYVRVGVPEEKLDYLATILLLGAAGLIVGLFWGPIGVAASACLVVYFMLAVAAHIRADDARSLPTPLAIEALAIAALVLRLATL
jgi:hypothetical protein